MGYFADRNVVRNKSREGRFEKISGYENRNKDVYKRQAQIVQETQAAPASPENRWHITLSPDETELLARIVWLESQGEPVKGQQAVVEVVFNRMRSCLLYTSRCV